MTITVAAPAARAVASTTAAKRTRSTPWKYHIGLRPRKITYARVHAINARCPLSTGTNVNASSAITVTSGASRSFAPCTPRITSATRSRTLSPWRARAISRVPERSDE